MLALKPDLILDVGWTSATFVSLADRVQEQTGIPYALLDGRFDARSPPIATLGELIGIADGGRGARPLRRRDHHDDQGPHRRDAGGSRPRVYYARGPRGLETGLGGSINVETIEMLGARTSRASARRACERLDRAGAVVESRRHRHHRPRFRGYVRSDPVWASVAAVRAGRVHLSPKLPFGWVDFPPSVNRLIGLWWLAKILYPDLFPEDMRALTRDFYRRFYHVTPSDAQIERVLAGRD